MRTFQNRLKYIIEKNNFKLNTISKISGVSNTYLAKLLLGRINRPGKDKITSVMLALNYPVPQINEVLADYDYQALNKLDIPDILHNNSRRKIEGGTIAQYDRVHIDLALAALELAGGSKYIVKDSPSVLFYPHELYMKKEYPFPAKDKATGFIKDLASALNKERKRLFHKNIEAGYCYETFICKHCLQEWIQKNLESGDDHYRSMILKYYANYLTLLQQSPDLQKLWIVERCPFFTFLIQDVDGKQPKVFYSGKKRHSYEDEYHQLNLEGFVTDSPAMVNHFKDEVDMCRKACVKQLMHDYPNKILDYFALLFQSFGLEREWFGALEASMNVQDLDFNK
ncbi:MAG: helix-turn-helix transcriptional regulator [Desulfobacteraceae bacterium]|nr:helix-turn-helix transcriptional regulator [Desulfobacteraceae bacterium]